MLFALVGGIGLIVHLLVLSIFRFWGPEGFGEGQLVATVVAMASNFVLNNEITYRRYRFRGAPLIFGFIAFAIACSAGVLANIDIASALYRSHQRWWLAGLAGALLSVVWNYAISTNFIWRPRRRG